MTQLLHDYLKAQRAPAALSQLIESVVARCGQISLEVRRAALAGICQRHAA